jgi:carbamoyltransferase
VTAILGISAFYHDSAAALVVDGRIRAAAQEERFSRVKHDAGFPRHAVAYCLREAGLAPDELTHVVFYEKPLLKFERLLETYLAVAPRGLASFREAAPLWLQEKLRQPAAIRRGLGGGWKGPIAFVEHHEAHAASAFYPSPFEDAAILTLDGVGEWATATLGIGRGRKIELTHELRFPHSLGLLYSAFTYFCGFRVNSGEYKLMGLAPFGEPRFEGAIREHLIDLKPDGSFRLDLSYFDYCAGLTMTSKQFDRRFGGPPRRPEAAITARECDLAASIQKVTEEAMLRMAADLHRRTGAEALCLAGGVALNCVGNGRLVRESPFRRLWIQPAAGDAGGALGAALFVWHQLLENPRAPQPGDAQSGSLLGPGYGPVEIEAALRSAGAVFHRMEDEERLVSRTADLLASGQVVAWVQGRMEFGPRALGARSILGDPRDPEMQSRMNRKIKFRESFRPFAPIVRRERASDWFDLAPDVESPYMLVVAPVRADRRRPADGDGTGLDRIRAVRSTIPAVTHLDGSARIQTVDSVRNPRLALLLGRFEERTGCPVLINTSFNIRGEPIVCTPSDAYRCFMATQIDALVIGDFVVLKTEQPAGVARDFESYLGKYGND